MNRRILVVEDNVLNAELLRDWLELEAYEVVAVSDIKRAREAINQGRCDAVLLDIRLGSEDGATLAAWIRRQPTHRNMPVIAVTAHALPAEQRRILQSGCSECVSKPIDFRKFREILNRWLSGATEPPVSSPRKAYPHNSSSNPKSKAN